MKEETITTPHGNIVTITYFDDGEECSREWYSTCPICGGRMKVHRLSDNTGGGEFCTEKDCHYSNYW